MLGGRASWLIVASRGARQTWCRMGTQSSTLADKFKFIAEWHFNQFWNTRESKFKFYAQWVINEPWNPHTSAPLEASASLDASRTCNKFNLNH